jgi:hypothetical protein
LNSSDPTLASLDLQPGSLLCSIAEVRFDSHPVVLNDLLPFLRDFVLHGARQVCPHLPRVGQQIVLTQFTQVRTAASSFSCILLTNMVMTLSAEQQIALVAIPRSLLMDAHVEVRSSAQTVGRHALYPPQSTASLPNASLPLQDLQRMLRSAALIAHVQELAREFHAQAITYPIKTQKLQQGFDCSVCIVRCQRFVI